MARILIVEDEPRIASFVAKGLRAEGHTTDRRRRRRLRASTWRCRGEFDLMVLDIGLPGMDGFERARRLRSQGSALPVIVLTARDSVTDTVEALEGGADDYMPKPFRFAELLARVRLRLRQAGAAARRRRTTSSGRRGAPGPADPPGHRRRQARSSCPPASSSWRRSSCSTPARCCPASSCSPTSGATTSTRAPTSSTSTSATCAGSRRRRDQHRARHGLPASTGARARHLEASQPARGWRSSTAPSASATSAARPVRRVGARGRRTTSLPTAAGTRSGSAYGRQAELRVTPASASARPGRRRRTAVAGDRVEQRRAEPPDVAGAARAPRCSAGRTARAPCRRRSRSGRSAPRRRSTVRATTGR